MKPSSKAISFLETLRIPEGPMAGALLRLAPFQKQFVRGAVADGVNVACLSIGRGNAKTALAAGIALGSVMGRLGCAAAPGSPDCGTDAGSGAGRL